MAYRMIAFVVALMMTMPAHADTAALRAGKPAGVLPAQDMRTTELYLFGMAGLASIGLGILLISHNKNTATSTTTTAP
jgi:hypothetical protein